MQAQTTILREFMNDFNHPSIKKTSELTGIQLTRVFRLLNGSQMKLSEYLIFNSLINQKKGQSTSLLELVNECSDNFSQIAMRDIENNLRRKLELWKLTQVQTKQLNQQLA